MSEPDIYRDEIVWAHAATAGEESWDGPFSTREEATFAALREEHAFICECRWISRRKVAEQAVDMDWLLERMDETDFICGTFDDPIFEVSPDKAAVAEAALAKALGEWAETYVDSGERFMCVGDPIRISEDIE